MSPIENYDPGPMQLHSNRYVDNKQILCQNENKYLYCRKHLNEKILNKDFKTFYNNQQNIVIDQKAAIIKTTATVESADSTTTVVVTPRRCSNRSRQLFGIQLEVTSLLLEAERRKLSVLQKELQLTLQDGQIKKAEEQLKQELILAISRIQIQYDLLEKEYQQHAIGRLRCTNIRGFGKSNRSQPAIGLKQTPKLRPTIFGTVADQCPKDSLNRRGLPQTAQSASKSGSIDLSSGGNGVHTDIHGKSWGDFEENALVYRDGNLISGSLNALLQHMVPTCDYYPDKSYLFAFLLSARLFIRPHELLAKICQLCDIQQRLDVPPPPTQSSQTSTTNSGTTTTTTTTTTTSSQNTSNTPEQNDKLNRFARQFVQLLTEWIETFPYDFRDDRLMEHVRSMTQKCINIDVSLRKEVSTMLQNLLHRLTVLDNYEEYLESVNNGIEISDPFVGNATLSQTNSSSAVLTGGSSTTTTSSTSSIGSTTGTNGDITDLCPNPTLLAHQLTRIELERLSHIGPEEFVQAFAKENPHLETSFNDMKKTRNLESYVQWFNRLSYLVATEIVKHSKKKQRVRIVEYWIETGRECFNIGNFNSLMAIIAGLNMSPISRLKKTWAKVQSAKFSILEHQMDPSSNFNSYRSTLKAAMWRSASATDERQRIVIPFFSLLVKDLYFLNEGCSNKLPNGHINFDKFWQLAKQVTEFIAWKQVTCTFDKCQKVIMFLQINQVLNENALAMASFECEPPDNNAEKERYKTLKNEQHAEKT